MLIEKLTMKLLRFGRNYSSLRNCNKSSSNVKFSKLCKKNLNLKTFYSIDTSCTSTQTISISQHVKKSQKIASAKVHIEPTVKTETDEFLFPEMPEECCGEECECCVWLLYVNEIMFLCKGNSERVEKALKCIPKPNVREYVRLEIKDKIGSFK